MKTTTKRPGWADRDMNVVRCRNVLFSPDSCLHPRCGALRAKYLRRRGIGYVWTAVFLLLIILLLGLSLDAAKVYLVAHQLHNAADAGALAGACIVKMDQDLARQQAIDTAYENLADHESVFLAPNPENDPNGDVVLGRWLPQSRTFEPTTANPNAVKVVTRRTTAHLTDGEGGPVSLNFGYIADVLTADVARYAIARSWGSTGAGLIALEEEPERWGPPTKPTGLHMGGNVEIFVGDGDIQVNAVSEDGTWPAFRADGDFTIHADEMNVTGALDPPLDPYGPDYWDDVNYPVTQGAPYIPDPLAGVPDLEPLPGLTEWDANTISSQFITENGIYDDVNGVYVLTLQPGYYPGGIRMTATGCKLVLEPGIYAFGGQYAEWNPELFWDPNLGEAGEWVPGYEYTGTKTGVVVTGGTFEALGCMLYITDSLTGKYGEVDIQGGTHTNVTITEYDSADPDTDPYGIYEGMTIFQDRANTEEAYITGSSEVYLTGSLYFKNANFRCGGGGLQCGTQLVAGTVEVDGNSIIYINYDGRYRVAGNKSHLVE